jgi:hypothetical protein
MKADFFVFVVGFLFVLFGVGGIEHSITSGELFTSCVVSCVGLLVMWVGTLMMRNNSEFKHDNPTLY